MHIGPDAAGAALDQAALGRRTLAALRRAGLVDAMPAPRDATSDTGGGTATRTREALTASGLELTGSDVSHPAVIDVAHTAQRALRADTLTAPRRAELATALARAVALARSATPTDHHGWSVEAAGPQSHLDRAVVRALAGVPPDSPGGAQDCAVTPWQDAHLRVLTDAAGLLRAAWPEMLDELTRTVRQVVLLRGTAIEGFTDFTVHGALFLHRDRLAPGADAPPGADGGLGLAEALVHEGTHVRCNAALASTPFWERAADRVAPVPTPLRADPRPLGGLFHQMVVLSRSATFLGRLLDSGSRPGIDPGPLRERHRHHRDAAARAAATLHAHRSSLTDTGRGLLAQVAAEGTG
ncbi:aKG-HExxH-type peptide beta-hydroxylase [Streptomyces spiramenti]|uniref:HEXXH motif domain-containing protein n=1 Tax=Streptomyces spiramenti TaxID=2720606 RepID=A0ABX1AF73_9ACTN|nr:HEXXH motif-containing putative peptide modification protein [Streptomyces spiramenti]NJP65759.1 hypothetical protein [Streptomyces spiramenti]